MNKKGFTLIELIVVLVILTLIMTIAIPNITSTIERRKDKDRKLRINLIESAAELYIDTHQNSDSVGAAISLKDLICEGYVTREQIRDPQDEEFSIKGSIKCVNTPEIKCTWEVNAQQIKISDIQCTK